MSWSFYLLSLLFFTLLLGVFYAVAFSVLWGIRDNYRRFYQKADLQWTGPARRPASPPFRWLIPLALLSAWLVVEFLVSPG